MLVLLLIGCDNEDALGDARARAADFLDENPVGTAIVQAPLASQGVEAVIGTRWHGADLAEWLAPCDLDAAAGFDATLRLEPGHFPWELLDDEDLPPCAAERLATFPFDEPSHRAEVDVVVVRWRPAERATRLAARESQDVAGIPAGLRALAPPYFRRSATGDALVPGEDLLLDHDRVRLRPSHAEVVAGPLEEPEVWARTLSCSADELELVRTVLVFWDGRLEEVRTSPENECVEDEVRDARKWMREQWVGGVRLADAGRVLVVLDVPVGAW